jgi:hypothetical protein
MRLGGAAILAHDFHFLCYVSLIFDSAREYLRMGYFSTKNISIHDMAILSDVVGQV